ncbi:MAG TPA: GSCFA domain-containing protein [Puia sp.]|nr:GSCFA domain-containing protein [Puia sp.]
MEFMLDMPITAPSHKINYSDPMLLIGSCFTEHISNYLGELKFNVLENPNGILFDPHSVAASIVSYIQNDQFTENRLFYLNELWHSWQHHSIFSNMDKAACLDIINKSQDQAHHFLKKTKWLIITLGSAFSYHLSENGLAVANCHRAPAQWFNKHLMTIEEINVALDNCIHQLIAFNPNIRVLFTVSPVRHIRDGVVENNRSKARLIEAVHHQVNKSARLDYFPAYELVIDVLRDYRFYDIDLIHPNYQATQFVLERFIDHFIDSPSLEIMKEVKKIIVAKKHRPLQPSSGAHKQFLLDHLEKAQQLKSRYPFLNMDEELDHFSRRPSQ